MIYYVRHGQTKDNTKGISTGQNDVPLTKEGIKQAKEIARELKNVDFDICFVSPLKRAKQTLSYILRHQKNIEVYEDERLIERCYGEIQGLSHKDEKVDPFEYSNRYNLLHKSSIKGMETVAQLKERIHSFFDFIKEKYKDKKVLVIAHGGIGRIVQCYFEGYPKSKDLCDVKNIDNGKYKAYKLLNKKPRM